MREQIEKLRHLICTGTTEEMICQTVEIIEAMSLKLGSLNHTELEQYQSQLQLIEKMMVNGDFFSISDIIKFELYPIFNRKES